MQKSKVGIVGATGLVGESFLEVLNERLQLKGHELSELRLFASEQSQGKTLMFGKKKVKVGGLHAGCYKGLDYVLFSSGDELSKIQSPLAVEEGAWVIDNSAAFRLHPDTPLIVPEVNGDILAKLRKPQIIANPNCSTIQLVVLLSPLKKKFGIERVFVASYQAASGAGREARDELKEHIAKQSTPEDSNYFATSLAYNVVPQIGSFDQNGFTSEEVKIMKETKKILRQHQLPVSAFTVRVPVLNAHSEAVWVTLENEVSIEEVLEALALAPGLIVEKNNQEVKTVVPRAVSGKDEVFVGRIHQDLDDPKTWIFWVVADNLRKGAATNAIQIAEEIHRIKN